MIIILMNIKGSESAKLQWRGAPAGQLPRPPPNLMEMGHTARPHPQ